MVHLQFNPSLLDTLKGKVVVLTGGATGIGRAAVQQFHAAGALLAIGDVNSPAASSLVSSLNSPSTILYQHCDTASYASQLSLFRAAFAKFGRIDIVVANAGVAVHKDPFAFSDADGNEEEEGVIEKEPSMAEVDVNLKGAVFSARLGVWFLRKNGKGMKGGEGGGGGDGGGEGGDVVLVSSIAGFKESAGLPIYTASKHGVVGLMRGLYLGVRVHGIRVNVVCPWMTKTRLVKGIEEGWYKLGLPTNEPEDVARSILLCATANRGNEESHPGAKLPFEGKIVWVGGGESYEIEDAIQALESQWLGEENSRVLAKGQEYLANGGTSWDADKGKS